MKVLRSQIGDEDAFRAAIGAHIAARLQALQTSGAIPPHDDFLDQFIKATHRPDPDPVLLELDYEIVDDPEPTIADKLDELRRAEAAEIEEIWPVNKRRLLEMDYRRALAAKEPTEADAKTIADFSAIHQRVEEIQYEYAQREAAL